MCSALKPDPLSPNFRHVASGLQLILGFSACIIVLSARTNMSSTPSLLKSAMDESTPPGVSLIVCIFLNSPSPLPQATISLSPVSTISILPSLSKSAAANLYILGEYAILSLKGYRFAK